MFSGPFQWPATCAHGARGTVVVIDVFRAFSVACYLFARGAEMIIPAGAIQDAWKFAGELPDAVLIGERSGKKLDGFHFGNSPSEIEGADFNGKTVIHTTHAGTQGIVNAINASEVLTGAFVNAGATCKYIRSKSVDRVTLVRMGLHATARTDEDDLCAEYLKALLLGERFDVAGIKEDLRASTCSNRFFDPDKPWSPEADFHKCLDTDRFDFVIRANGNEGRVAILEKIEI
jgi:2-phosphosulfolactate phosphatase